MKNLMHSYFKYRLVFFQRNASLDAIPRSKETTRALELPLNKLVQAVQELKSKNKQLKVFDELDEEELQQEAEKAILEVVYNALQNSYFAFGCRFAPVPNAYSN